MTILEKITKQVDQLSANRQKQVLDFARSLSDRKGVPGKELLRFAGSISEPDAKVWQEAVEEGCERVDAHP